MIDQGRKKELFWSGRLAVAALALFVAQNGVADPVHLGLRIQERFSDNIRLSHTNTESDLEHQAILSISHQTNPGPCGSSLAADLGFIHYQKGTYSDQGNINGNWNGSCQLTDSLQWTASDNVSQETVNTAQASTPDNQTRRNLFSTGPRYLWLISPRDQLLTTAQFQKTNYTGLSQSNAKHYIGSSTYSHQVSPTLSMGLGASVDRGELDTGETITRRSGHFQSSKTFATTTFSGNVGYSELADSFSGITNTYTGLTWNLRLDRDMTRARHWYAEYGRELTDTSSNYVVQVAGLFFNLAQTQAVQVTHWQTGIKQTLTGDGTLSLSLGQQDTEYLRAGNTEKKSNATFSLSQPLITNLSALVSLSAEHQSYSLSDVSYNLYGGSLGLSYQRSQQLSLDMRIGRNQRAASPDSGSYQENWALIGFNYAFR